MDAVPITDDNERIFCVLGISRSEAPSLSVITVVISNNHETLTVADEADYVPRGHLPIRRVGTAVVFVAGGERCCSIILTRLFFPFAVIGL